MSLKKVLLFPVKVAGTATMAATTVVGSALRHASDVAGFDLGSDVGCFTQDCSVEVIKWIWGAEPSNPSEADCNNKIASEKLAAANKCREMAEAARKAGNTEREEMFMDRYYALKEEIEYLKKEAKREELEDGTEKQI